MKSTGIVRRIDELGRIVIPKEIRNTLNIDNSDELEIYVENNRIILQKYSLLFENKEKHNKIFSAVTNLVDGLLFITDKEKVINNCLYENAKISNEIKQIIAERRIYSSNYENTFIIGKEKITGYFCICPIIKNSIINGSIIIVKKDKILETDIVFIDVLKNIIEKS